MKFLFPYSYASIIKTALDGSKTLLDVGCGNGFFMTFLNFNKGFEVTGVELFEPYIKQAKQTGMYNSILKKDIRKLGFKENEFDAVLSSQVVEHFTKNEGIKVIKFITKFAKNVVVIGTPNGHFHQEAYDHNDLQEHLSTWYPEDLEKLGFKVYGQGLKIVYGENGLLNSSIGKISFFRYLLFIFSYLFSPFVYFNPKYATYLVGIYKK